MKNIIIALSLTVFCQSMASAMMLSPQEQERRQIFKALRKQKMQEFHREIAQRPLAPGTLENALYEQGRQHQITQAVCSAVEEVYQKINTHWTYVGLDHKLHTDSKYWEPIWIKAKCFRSGQSILTKSATLRLISSPNTILEALEDLVTKPAALECTLALDVAKIFCLKEILGEYEFKQYATNLYAGLGQTEGLSTDTFFNTLSDPFLKRIEGVEKPGSIAYITNIASYGNFKPRGSGSGSNVFCVGNDQYVGFSRIYKSGPQPLKVIEQQDYELFCKTEDVEQFHERHKELCELFKGKKGLFEHIRRKEQAENCNFYFIFDHQAIEDFRKTGNVELQAAENK